MTHGTRSRDDPATGAAATTTDAVTGAAATDAATRAGADREEAFRRACEVMSDGMVICSAVRDETGTIVDFRCDHLNRSAGRILGMADEQMLGRRLSEIFPVYAGSGLFRRQAATVANGGTHSLRGLRYEGEWPGQGYTARFFDGTTTACGDGFVGVFRDVTLRQDTADELERRVRERTAELTAANAELATFSYSVSHDLRAPLRAIEGFSQIVLRDHAGRLDPDGRHALDRVIAGVARMNELIDALLGLSRVSSHPISAETVDVTRLTAEVAEELKATCPDHPALLTVQPGMTVYADPQLLRVLLTNLLSNACKFTVNTPSPEIEIGCRCPADGDAVFYVRDNGAGFDMMHADRLFRPFERLHRQSEYSGTGVGLATVQRIVRRHGGRVWARAAVNEGATIYFTFPAPPRRT